MKKMLLFMIIAVFIISGCDSPTANVVKEVELPDIPVKEEVVETASVKTVESCEGTPIEGKTYIFSKLSPYVIFKGTVFGVKIENMESESLKFKVIADVFPNGDKNLKISKSEIYEVIGNAELESNMVFVDYELKDSDKWNVAVVPVSC